MAQDPLASFRTTPAALRPAVAPAAPVTGKEPYRAYMSRDKHRNARIEVRPKGGLTHAIGYNFLYEIVYDRRDYTEVGLFFSTLIVKLHGRNLKPVVDAIRLGSCDYVEEFDQRYYDSPEDESEPFIAGMEIVSAAAARAAGKGGTK